MESKTDYPIVSIITVNYNGIEDTIDFIQSVKTLTYPKLELIVVDNCSPKGFDSQQIKDAYPETVIIESSENLGFAGGNNLGIKAAKGDFLLFLNNDTLVSPGLIEPLISQFRKDDKTAMVSPKIVFHHSDNVIQYAGANRIKPIVGRGSAIGTGEKDSGQYDEVRTTDLGNGAAMMVSKEIIDEVGLMPELYFLYYEEHDWAMQMKRKGYSIYYVGKTKVMHKESASTGRNSPYKTYFMCRNRLIYLMRNQSLLFKILSLFYFLFIALPKNIFTFLWKGQKDLAASYSRGFMDFIKYYFLKKDIKAS
ncbi:MAG: glycosyltransferase family 2 protein [Cytophagales bacterium]|nr:glycosyltransferase family 2 protein [Cytophagales bacterium]